MTDQPKTVAFNSSSDLNELFAALAKCQATMGAAIKDSENPFFKSSYADIAACWDACRGPMTANGLSVVQLPTEGQTVKVVSVLGHSSGQWLSNTVELRPTKNDPQGYGSALTYARRYGLMALVGICPEDDDGNEASKGDQRGKQPTPADELRRLGTVARQTGWTHAQMLEVCGGMWNVKDTRRLNVGQIQELIGIVKAKDYDTFMSEVHLK